MKSIIFGRHAKSSWEDFSIEDHDRTLNKRGFKDANIMGNKLKEMHLFPDVIISSSAKRAKLTAEIYLDILNHGILITVKDLYLAPYYSFIKKANELDNKYQMVMMIAHNPGITGLANKFSDSIIDNVPTSGLFKVDFDIDKWSEVNTYNGKMDFFIFPKMFK